MTIDQQIPLGSGFTGASTTTDVLAGVDLTGRTAVVTGASSGLGLVTARALAAAGARVLAPVRDAGRAGAALRSDRGVTVIDALDLADLHSVARSAERVGEQTVGVDIVIAAAGVMAGPDRRVGPGWEHQFAVNHVGHFAFITRLAPLLARRGARVVVYSSAGHHASDIRWDDPHFLGGYDRWLAYGQSKTANALFAAELDRRGADSGVRAISLHPGKIITGLQRDLPHREQMELGWIDASGAVIGEGFVSPDQGAATGVWAATSPALRDRGGLYLENCDVARVARPGGSMDDGGVMPHALDVDSARRLWEMSVAMTGTDLGRP